MTLLVRIMRDKYGSRNYVVFRDEDGISKPLALLTEIEADNFVEMFASEEKLLDEFVRQVHEQG